MFDRLTFSVYLVHLLHQAVKITKNAMTSRVALRSYMEWSFNLNVRLKLFVLFL